MAITTEQEAQDLSKLIVFKSIYSAGQNSSTTISPALSRHKGRPSVYSEEQWRKIKIGEEPEYKFTISHGKELDLNNEEDAKIWEWVKVHPEICNRETGKPYTQQEAFSVNKLWYVYRPDEEALKLLQKTDLEYEAMKHANESTPDELRNVCRLYGYYPSAYKDAEIKLLARTKAKENPAEYLKRVKHENFTYLILVHTALEKDIIKNVAGIYSYGTYQLGDSPEEAAKVIASPSSKAMREKLMNHVYPKHVEEVKEKTSVKG